MSTRYTSTGAERAALRGRLHGESPVVQVGREGLSDGVVASVGEALAAREVIKVRFGKGAPVGPAEGGRELAERVEAELLGTVGRVVMLYRPRPDAEQGPAGVRTSSGRTWRTRCRSSGT